MTCDFPNCLPIYGSLGQALSRYPQRLPMSQEKLIGCLLLQARAIETQCFYRGSESGGEKIVRHDEPGAFLHYFRLWGRSSCIEGRW